MTDALQGVAYDNDSQIVEIHAQRFDAGAAKGVVDVVVRVAA